MSKISSDCLRQCNSTNCCMNEFVSLPEDGDVGFEEYYEHKAKEIVKCKKIFSPLDQNMLMLAYPKPDAKEPYVFERFFESPTIVARNHEFEGCFAIDVSAYIGKENDEYFDKLMSFIHRNKNAVYVLFMYSNNVKEIESMYESVSQYDEIRKVNIPLPSAKELTEYTIAKIRDFSLHVKSPVYSYLQKYYSQRSGGFDYADYLVRYLKDKNYQGDLPEMKETVLEIDAKTTSGGSKSNFGY